MTKNLLKKTIPVPNTDQSIELQQCTHGLKNVLLIGGVHGDEPEGFFLVEKFLKHSNLWAGVDGQVSLWVIPRLNPFGCSQNLRINKNSVDLNRNMPTKDWVGTSSTPRYFPGSAPASEFETNFLIETIETLKPHLIISVHSWNPMINYNGPCLKVAKVMAALTKYKVTDDIGYPTPGSLGTWAGWERKIPVITLEIERGASEGVIWSTHAPALEAALKFAAENSNLE